MNQTDNRLYYLVVLSLILLHCLIITLVSLCYWMLLIVGRLWEPDSATWRITLCFFREIKINLKIAVLSVIAARLSHNNSVFNLRNRCWKTYSGVSVRKNFLLSFAPEDEEGFSAWILVRFATRVGEQHMKYHSRLLQ